MIDLNRKQRVVLAGFAATALMWSAPASAQQAPPPASAQTDGQAISPAMQPSTVAPAGTTPRSLLPGSGNGGTIRPRPPGAGLTGFRTTRPAQSPRARTGFAVNQLTAPGRGAAGLLTGANGGLPSSLWQGASAARVTAILNRIPRVFRSAAARQIARKLYLSAGSAPQGFSNAEFLTMRMSRLIDLGYFTDAATLGQAGTGARQSVETAIEIFRADLLAGRGNAACAAATPYMEAADTFLQQLRAYCDLIAGRTAEAELVVGLLGESPDADHDFLALAETLAAGEAVEIGYRPNMSPVSVALMRRHAGAVFTKTQPDTDAGDAALARALFATPGLTPEQKAEFGMLALQYSGLSDAPVLTSLQQLPTPATDYRGLLVTAMKETEGLAKAEVLASAWKQALENAELDFAARLSKSFTASLRPGQGYDFIAADLVRILAVNGEIGPAQQWLQVVRRQAASGDDAARASLNKMAPIALVLEGRRASPETLAAWSANLEMADAAQVRARTYLLIEALGMTVPDRLWNREMLTPGPNPDGADVVPSDWALWRHIVVPAGAGQPGTAVAAALAMIGEQGPADMEPIGIATIVGALRAVGLQADARQLVLEALIADMR